MSAQARWRRLLAGLCALGVLAGVAAAVAVVDVDAGAAERSRAKLRPDPLDIIRAPGKYAASARRHVVLHADRVDLMRGATVLESLPIDGRRATLPGVAAAVARSSHPDWLEQTAPGVFLARVALVQGRGTTLSVAAPATRALRLLSHPEVYVVGLGATGLYRRVTVTSWDEGADRPDPNPRALRPFVLYGPGSVLDIERSRFGYLGADRSRGAYGVTWEGATGRAVAATFHNNFFGAYTFAARDIAFVGNVFRDNALYGLDPHDYTTGLRVVANRAFRNGTHGIVFSVGVTGAVVRANHSHDNGANGIVMDERSDRNLITGNLVERNRGDGIVLLGSSDVTVRHNEVRGNRVGVRVNLRSARNLIEHNLIQRNRRGVELYGGARDTRLAANQILDSAGEGMALEAPASVSDGDTVRGGRVGVEVRGLARLRRTAISGVAQGVVVTARGIATVEGAEIVAADTAVHVQPGGLTRVAASHLDAHEPFEGAAPRLADGNTLVAPMSALPWLAMAGAAFLVLAVLLQLVHRTRNRLDPSVVPTGREGPADVSHA
jgi:parallel beta-helix repeat protein